LRINYDFQINSLGDEEPVPVHLAPPPAGVSTVPRKIYAFADDGNCMTTMDLQSLHQIKVILENFGSLSGLECNVEKTGIMQVGSDDPIPQEVRDLGFTCCQELKILGLTIRGDTGNFMQSLSLIENKVKNIAAHWRRFNLSLPGRINIAKCMMYSQINYLGCFLNIPRASLQKIEEIIEKFVMGNLKIAKKRLYLKPEDGGIGLIDLETFLMAQKCSWIKRAKNLNDTWKQKLYYRSLGSLDNLRKRYFDAESEPILHGFAESFEKFTISFTKTNENFWKSRIFENEALPVNSKQ